MNILPKKVIAHSAPKRGRPPANGRARQKNVQGTPKSSTAAPLAAHAVFAPTPYFGDACAPMGLIRSKEPPHRPHPMSPTPYFGDARAPMGLIPSKDPPHRPHPMSPAPYFGDGCAPMGLSPAKKKSLSRPPCLRLKTRSRGSNGVEKLFSKRGGKIEKDVLEYILLCLFGRTKGGPNEAYYRGKAEPCAQHRRGNR